MSASLTPEFLVCRHVDGQSFLGRNAYSGCAKGGPIRRDRQLLTSPHSTFHIRFGLLSSPNPPASMRRAMLKTIAQEYKFNIIRIYSSWVYHNREPDRFNFEELEEVMGYCDEFGLRVLMGVNTEDAPYWLERPIPKRATSTAKDQPFRLGGSSGNVSGGWPGLCLDWEPVRQAAAKFIQEMAKTVGEASVDVRLRLLERTAHGAVG